MSKEVLDTKVIEDYGSFKRIREWVRGKHRVGKIIRGHTGWETVIDRDAVYPARTVRVTRRRTPDPNKQG